MPVEIAVCFEQGFVHDMRDRVLIQMLKHRRGLQMRGQAAFAIQPVHMLAKIIHPAANIPQTLPTDFQQFRRPVGDYRGGPLCPAQGGNLAKHITRSDGRGAMFVQDGGHVLEKYTGLRITVGAAGGALTPHRGVRIPYFRVGRVAP